MRMKQFGKPLLRKLKIGPVLWKSIKEFLSTTYMHSYHYLADADRKAPEKIMWLILHCTTLTLALNVVMIAWARFTDNPTITMLESQHHSIYSIPFPAISICPTSKMSRIKAEEYADYLVKKRIPKVQYRSRSYILSMIEHMGRLYDFELSEFDAYSKFQEEVLDKVDSDNVTATFNTRKKLMNLAPSCSDIVIKCKWGGEDVNCTEIISTRRSNEGFCCAFNYVRPSEEGNFTKAKTAAGIGPEMGLTVLLNLSDVDTFYRLKNFIGATALIFDPNEFPDSSTGFVREVPLEPNVETRITLGALTKKAVDDVQRYSIQKRECLFPIDNPSEWKGNYNFGDCLIKCKLKSIMALCKCSPYNFPTNFDDVDKDLSFCNLGSIQCMNKYRVKWGTFKPREFIKVLERDIEDSLNCEGCYPMCSSTSYIVDSTSARLNFNYENKGSIIAGMNASSDLSILKLYFPEVDSVLYKTDVLFAWYDIVSDYGGIIALFLGCSIITVFEIIFYTTIRFYQNLMNSTSFMKNFQKHKPTVFDNNKIINRAKFDFIH